MPNSNNLAKAKSAGRPLVSPGGPNVRASAGLNEFLSFAFSSRFVEINFRMRDRKRARREGKDSSRFSGNSM